MEVKVYESQTDKEYVVERSFDSTDPGAIFCPKCGVEIGVCDVAHVGPCSSPSNAWLIYQCGCGFSCSGVEDEVLSKEELEAVE